MKTAENKYPYNLYLDAFDRTATGYACASKQFQGLEPMPYIKKLVTYGIKMVNAKPESTTITRERAILDFKFAETILQMIGTLTPQEFIGMFPIEKRYDGHKYQCKDYYYTRDYIRSLPAGKAIGQAVPVMEFLWEYQNWEINHFLVNALGFADNLRRLEGQPSMAEVFCAEKGINTYRLYTDEKNKQFMVDSHTGKSYRIKKKIPRYLRLVDRKKDIGKKITAPESGNIKTQLNYTSKLEL